MSVIVLDERKRAPVARGNATGNEMERGTSRATGPGSTSASPVAEKRSNGPQTVPPELLAFVGQHSVRRAAAALGLGVGQVHRLTQGYWPRDPRRTLAAWDAYRTRSVIWRLRLVRQGSRGPYVRERSQVFTAPALDGRQGQQVLITAQSGGLLAQTIDAPVQHFTLAPMQKVPS